MKTITAIMMILVSFVAVKVTSARETNDFNRTTIRREFQTNAWVKVTGHLICDNASGNTACQINLQDNKTGEIYRLSRTEKAMELLNAGTKAVQIEGRLTGKTIAINQISAL
jgi:hypothetical protein